MRASEPDLTSVREAVLALLEEVRSAGTYIGPPGTQVCIRDVVQTRTTTARCFLGPLSTSVQRRIRNQRGACSRFRCPHCVDYRLLRTVYRALRIWDYPDHLYRREFSKSAWASRAAKAVRDEHPYYLVVNAANGDKVMLSPDPIPAGDEVGFSEFVQTLLRAKLKRAFDFAKTEERRARDDAPSPPREGRTRVWARVSDSETFESLKYRYGAALDSALDWKTELGRRGTPFSQADTSRALSDAEYERAADVARDLRAERVEELRDMRDARRMLKDAAGDDLTTEMLRRWAADREDAPAAAEGGDPT